MGEVVRWGWTMARQPCREVEPADVSLFFQVPVCDSVDFVSCLLETGDLEVSSCMFR